MPTRSAPRSAQHPHQQASRRKRPHMPAYTPSPQGLDTSACATCAARRQGRRDVSGHVHEASPKRSSLATGQRRQAGQCKVVANAHDSRPTAKSGSSSTRHVGHHDGPTPRAAATARRKPKSPAGAFLVGVHATTQHQARSCPPFAKEGRPGMPPPWSQESRELGVVDGADVMSRDAGSRGQAQSKTRTMATWRQRRHSAGEPHSAATSTRSRKGWQIVSWWAEVYQPGGADGHQRQTASWSGTVEAPARCAQDWSLENY